MRGEDAMKSLGILKLVILFLFSVNVLAQSPPSVGQDHPDRTKRVEPFKIIDNIYFVGTTIQAASYLITGSEGHVIFDSTYEDRVPMILESVEKLGFNPKDVKLLIGTHAHSDHVGGHSVMQEMTGADILSSIEDKATVESGGDGSWAPAEVNRIIDGGEVITLGDIEIKVHDTPGHTPGTLTFTMVAEEEGKKYNVILLGGLRIATTPLLGNKDYPNLAEDMAATFYYLEQLPVDVYLGAHGYWYDLRNKIPRIPREGYRAFINPQEYRDAVNGWQQVYINMLVEESKALVR